MNLWLWNEKKILYKSLLSIVLEVWWSDRFDYDWLVCRDI